MQLSYKLRGKTVKLTLSDPAQLRKAEREVAAFRRLKERGERASWTTLRGWLAGQQRVTVVFRREDGQTLHVRKATQAEPASGRSTTR